MKETKSVTILTAPEKILSRGPAALTVDEETGRLESDQEKLSKRYESVRSGGTCSGGDLHMLVSYRPGESKVEKMAHKIQTRIEERVPVTFNARRTFLKTCRKIAVREDYSKKSVVKYSDILSYREEVKDQAGDNDAAGIFSRLSHALGFVNDKCCLAEILDKAEVIGNKVGLELDDNFHYQEFNFFHTVLVSRYPWMRHELLFAFGLVFTFYLMTPILFCTIIQDGGICPRDAKVPGWVSALYFASTTMSTVGYGDLSVEKDQAWKVAIGMLYMCVAMLVALLAFSAAAEKAMSPVKSLVKCIARISPITYPEGPLEEGEYLYQRIRKVKWVALFDVAFQFIVLNGIGVLASQAFIEFTEVDPGRNWSWVDSIYWSVQTTTTIGYGDYSMPEYMRPFQIFYLTLGTYFTGSALGRLSALKEELEKIRRYHAFERREVNRHMLHYLASTDDPTRVDQYEFVIASLLNLGKIDADDIEPIMDKFRSLARHSGHHTGYIRVEDIPEPTDDSMSDLSQVEGVEGA